MAKQGQSEFKDKNEPKPKLPGTRPPVVVVLGHVDHGKTTLLDYIRKTHVAEKEFGGITQHIRAYQIEHAGRAITFIDTPGHEAFSAMRARGGQVSDLALLVVAADDGVMPQTRESIAHIKAAGIPFLVAINKIDLPGVNVEQVKKQLAEAGVLVEGYGGDIVAVPISAKTGRGVDELLEMISLLADIQELKGEPTSQFKGIVVEARQDKNCGPVALIVVKEGTLKLGSPVYTQSASGKVRCLKSGEGGKLQKALPSMPVEVLGFSSVPKVGEIVRDIPEGEIQAQEKLTSRLPREAILKTKKDEVRLIVKADTAGSLEAITNCLEVLKKGDQKVKIYYAETGDITEGDVLLAAATSSIIIGFNVSISGAVQRLANEEKVLVRKYKLIYNLLEELKEGLEALNEEKPEEKILGEAEIVKIFKVGGKKIAGCRAIFGRINRSDLLVVKREGQEIARSKIVSMKHGETNINEAIVGQEFGLLLQNDPAFTKGDIIAAIGPSVTK